MITENESHRYFSTFPHNFNRELLEVIIDYNSAYVTYKNEIDSKIVHFPGRDAPDKINRGG